MEREFPILLLNYDGAATCIVQFLLRFSTPSSMKYCIHVAANFHMAHNLVDRPAAVKIRTTKISMYHLMHQWLH